MKPRGLNIIKNCKIITGRGWTSGLINEFCFCVWWNSKESNWPICTGFMYWVHFASNLWFLLVAVISEYWWVGVAEGSGQPGSALIFTQISSIPSSDKQHEASQGHWMANTSLSDNSNKIVFQLSIVRQTNNANVLPSVPNLLIIWYT